MYFRQQKFKLLSLLPTSWSINKIQKNFNASSRLIRSTKNSIENRISDQEHSMKKKGRQSLDIGTEEKVVQFYENEENSKQLPGKKDVKSVRQADGTRKQMQKKLILCNLSELYESFKEKYPNDKISFSKFASLRPQHCVLAGSSGTHTVCVCTVHENVKLMLEG